MRKIKLDFARYSDPALLVLAQSILAALTGNLFFPSPSPTLAVFQAAITAYSDALSAAANRGKNEVTAKNARRQELIDVLFNLALDVMKTADGNEEALVSSAFPLTRQRQPLLPLGIPVIAKIELGLNAGELEVILGSLQGARTFVYKYTPEPLTAGSVWESVNSTRIKETISGLESGKKYLVQIVAYGTNNQMTVCEPVLSKIVQ